MLKFSLFLHAKVFSELDRRRYYGGTIKFASRAPLVLLVRCGSKESRRSLLFDAARVLLLPLPSRRRFLIDVSDRFESACCVSLSSLAAHRAKAVRALARTAFAPALQGFSKRLDGAGQFLKHGRRRRPWGRWNLQMQTRRQFPRVTRVQLPWVRHEWGGGRYCRYIERSARIPTTQ